MVSNPIDIKLDQVNITRNYPIYIQDGEGKVFTVETLGKKVEGKLLCVPGVLEMLMPLMPDYEFVVSACLIPGPVVNITPVPFKVGDRVVTVLPIKDVYASYLSPLGGGNIISYTISHESGLKLTVCGIKGNTLHVKTDKSGPNDGYYSFNIDLGEVALETKR